MLNFIRADLRRIFFRIPRVIGTLLVYAILFVVLFIIQKGGVTSVTFLELVSKFISYLPLIWGLFILIAIFADDFRAKTMQVAIGLRIPRSQIVIGKLIETIILTVFEISLLFLFTVGASIFMKAGLNASQIHELMVKFFMAGVNMVGYISLTMILMFFTQSTGGGRILYLALNGSIIYTILDIVSVFETLEPLRLTSFSLTYLLSVAEARWIIGIIDIRSWIGIILYLVISTILTIVLFRRRELEF